MRYPLSPEVLPPSTPSGCRMQVSPLRSPDDKFAVTVENNKKNDNEQMSRILILVNSSWAMPAGDLASSKRE